MRNLASFLVHILYTLALLGSPSLVHAQSACSGFFEKTAARRPLSKAGQIYVEGAEWLSQNRNKINVKKTHLSGVVPVAEIIIERVLRNLDAKKDEPEFKARSPMVKSVLTEMRSRIENGRFTYEYMYGLPLRLGFLLEMRGEMANGDNTLYPPVELPIVFDAQNYLTHEAFMKMALRSSTYKAPKAYRASIFEKWAEGLKSDSKILALFGDLGYRSLNLLVTRDVWPVGTVTSVKNVDGLRLNEFGFPYHDFGHFFFRHEFYPGDEAYQIPYDLIRSYDRATIDKIETSDFGDGDFTLLHFLHYNTFHEEGGTSFILKDKNNEWSTHISKENIRIGMTEILEKILKDALTVRNDGSVLPIQEELDKLLQPGETRADALNRMMPVYRRMLLESIDGLPLPN